MNQELNNLNKSTDNFPIRESAFYNQIKSSTETGDKASFALLMSMLTKDAQELDEFHLPHTKDSKIKSDLYGQFNVQQKTITGEHDKDRSIEFNQLIHQGNRTTVALELAIKPEPLTAEPRKFPQQLLESLEPNVRSRIVEESPKNKDKPAIAKTEKEIDVESWFKVLHESRAIATAA